MPRLPPPTPAEFLAPFAPIVRQTADAARAAILAAVPGAVEAVYPGWKLIGYRVPDPDRPKKTHYFAFVLPDPAQPIVKLGFEYGALMTARSLLRGHDRMHRVRYIELRTPADADPAKLRPIIREAANLAVGRAPDQRPAGRE